MAATCDGSYGPKFCMLAKQVYVQVNNYHPYAILAVGHLELSLIPCAYAIPKSAFVIS